jgi:hypothetical protein
VLDPALAPGSTALFTFGGDCADHNCRATVDRDLTIVADVSAGKRIDVFLGGDGDGTISSDPEGITCPGRCSAVFPPDQPVVLEATTDDPHRFRTWAGIAGCDQEATCTIAAEVEPVDRNGLKVPLVLTPFGLDTTGDEIVVRAGDPPNEQVETITETREFLYDPDVTTKVRLTAVPSDAETHKFLGWSGVTCDSNNPLALDCGFDLPAKTDRFGVAQFELRPKILLTFFEHQAVLFPIVPAATFDCSTGAGPFAPTVCGAIVDRRTLIEFELKAVSDEQDIGVRWAGCPTQVNGPFTERCSFLAHDDAQLVGTFESLPTLFVSIDTAGASVTANGLAQAPCAALADCTYVLPFDSLIEVTHNANLPVFWDTCPSLDLMSNPCTFRLDTETASVVGN